MREFLILFREFMMLINFFATVVSALMALMIYLDPDQIVNLKPMGFMLALISVVCFINVCRIQSQNFKDYQNERISHRVILRPPLYSDDD